MRSTASRILLRSHSVVVVVIVMIVVVVIIRMIGFVIVGRTWMCLLSRPPIFRIGPDRLDVVVLMRIVKIDVD